MYVERCRRGGKRLVIVSAGGSGLLHGQPGTFKAPLLVLRWIMIHEVVKGFAVTALPLPIGASQKRAPGYRRGALKRARN